MSSQSEEHQTSQPEDENGVDSDAVRTRVSELLDNATVAPDDDFGRKDLVSADTASDGLVGDGLVDDDPVRTDVTDDKVVLNAAEEGDAAENATIASSVGGDAPPDEAPQAGSILEEHIDAVADDGATEQSVPFTESVDAVEHREERANTVADDVHKSATGTPLTSVETEAAMTAEAADTTDSDPAGEAPVETGGDQITATTVRIRGRPGGVLVEIDNEGEWKEILALLEKRLEAAEGFFRGGKAVIEVGPRDVYEDELRQVRDMLARHDMTLVVVHSTSDLTLQSALLLGLSTSSQPSKTAEASRDMAPVVPITQPTSPYYVHNGTLRSGQILRKSESIVVVGDVNPGAKIISGGDVMVWGRLRGMAYAGATGNKDALVAAIEFSPTQLRIASVTAVPPDPPKRRGLLIWKKSEPEKRPEVAHVTDGRIVVEPWDDSRPGRPKLSRR